MSNLSTNNVSKFLYKLSGNFVLKANSNGTSLTLPSYMAKNPKQENFRFWVDNDFLPVLRVQENTQNNVWIGTKETLTTDLSIHYEITF